MKATEVASEPVAAEPIAPEPVASRVEASPEPPPQAASPPPGPPRSEARTEPPPPPPPPSSASISWLPPDFPWPAAAAGAAGAAGVMFMFMIIWLATPRSDATAALTPRLAAIESQLRDIAARPAPQGVDPAALGTLSDRLAKLEGALNAPRPAAAPDPALTARIGAIEGAIKPIGDSVTALTRRADDADAAFRNVRGRADAAAATLTELQSAAKTSTADHGEIDKLANRIAALERTDRTVADQLAKSAAASGNDRAARLAVAASTLRVMIERGDPFAAELAAVKPLTGDAAALAAIEPFAATGVPGVTALGRELILQLPVMHRAAGVSTRDSGFLDRLQANAEKLVRIRPVEEMPGEEPAAILSRIEVKAAHGDIAGALAELAKLPPSVRAPALAWIAKAEARGKAIEAGRRLAYDAMAALKTNP